jgi:stalled ribosome rescue protein Dom34
MAHYHAVVWLDAHEARVFHVTETEAEKITVRDRKPDRHLHSSGTKTRQHGHADEDYLHRIVEALSGASEWLIVGPGEAKNDLMRHIEAHDPAFRARIKGVETADHPSDGQVCALARRHFAKLDRTLPQRE